MENDRQLRQWVFILYDDNENHQFAIDEIKSDILKNKGFNFDYCIMHHIPIIDLDDKLIKKGHSHVVMWFDSPIRKSTLVKRLNLNKDVDSHLFKGLDEFRDNNGKRKFDSIDNYLDYQTHIGNLDKPDKYSFDDFITNVPDRVYEAINKFKIPNSESFMKLVDFMFSTKTINKDVVFWGMAEWYQYLYKKGYGETAYKNWYRFKDIVNEIKITIG